MKNREPKLHRLTLRTFRDWKRRLPARTGDERQMHETRRRILRGLSTRLGGAFSLEDAASG
jgi:hypothetical protein